MFGFKLCLKSVLGVFGADIYSWCQVEGAEADIIHDVTLGIAPVDTYTKLLNMKA